MGFAVGYHALGSSRSIDSTCACRAVVKDRQVQHHSEHRNADCSPECPCSSHAAACCRATDAINASLGSDNVEFMELDVGSLEKIRSFVSKFKAKDQPLHILVNNAGLSSVLAPDRSILL